jgi:hypothetical protein
VIGGSAEQRLQVAYAYHRDGLVRPGTFVCLDGGRDESQLKLSLESRLSSAGPVSIGDPLRTAEHGTLFLDSIARLSKDTQRMLLTCLQHRLDLSGEEDEERWSGRLIAGNAEPFSWAAGEESFSVALFDALDKVRVELPTALEEHVA